MTSSEDPHHQQVLWPPPAMGRGSLNLRVSDAERAGVADLLSRHYADGRLDPAEFDDRLHAALGAKTRADLLGVLADLPQFGAEGVAPRGSGRPPSLAGVVLACGIVALLAASFTRAAHLPLLLVLMGMGWLLLRRHVRRIRRARDLSHDDVGS